MFRYTEVGLLSAYLTFVLLRVDVLLQLLLFQSEALSEPLCLRSWCSLLNGFLKLMLKSTLYILITATMYIEVNEKLVAILVSKSCLRWQKTNGEFDKTCKFADHVLT